MQYLQHPQHRTSPSPSATSSANTPTREELQEQNEELKRLLRKYKEKPRATETKIKPIVRPKGEAGSRKRGFILYDAMQMGKVENGPIVYDRMRDCVRKSCIKVGMDLSAHYRCQDPEKLGQAFDLVRKAFPYLTPERFPQNWAVAEMVKGYIAGTRKERHRQAREDEEARDTMSANKTGYSSDASEPEASSDSSSRSKPKKRCRELEDDSHSQINAKRVARSSAGTKPKKRRNSNSDIYATCEPEDAASQTSSKSARSSLGTKPNDTPDQASTTKAIRLNFTSRPRKHDAKTKRATRDMSNSGRKQSISTPGACHPRSESDRQNDDDDDDSVPEQPPKKRHAQTRRSTRNTLNSGGRQSLENTSGKRHQPSEFDDGNKDDNNNLNQHCDSFDQDRQRLGTQSRRLTLKIPSKSRPSSEMKLIDEDNG